MNQQVLGIDWGTTNRRAYLVDAQGKVLRSHADDRGMLAERGRFAESLESLRAAMQVPASTRVIMSGMVGSAQGWCEAPYLDTNVPLAELPRHLVKVAEAPGTVSVVPGYCQRSGSIDVMRGEETQLLGALALGQGDGWVVLPGTHSKWVLLNGGRIQRLSTYMTGELFASLSRDGTLSALINSPDAREDAAAFEAGLRLARERAPLTHSLFSVRARVVSGAMPAACARSFASGLLIGAEFAAAIDEGTAPGRISLVGSEALVERYRAAAAHFGVAVTTFDPDAVYCAALSTFITEGQ